jgi:hypothetical protein
VDMLLDFVFLVLVLNDQKEEAAVRPPAVPF